MKKFTFILLLSILSTGCASVGSRVKEDYTYIDKGIYPGVRGDISWLGGNLDPLLQGAELIIYPLAIYDLPIAAVLDTVLLPVDILEQNLKVQKIRELAEKYFPKYKIIENKKKNASRFALVSNTGEKIDFEDNCSTCRRLNEFIKGEDILVPSEKEAKEVVQLTMMIIFGYVDIAKDRWHFQVDRTKSTWTVAIKNKQGGQLGNIWVLNVDANNRLEKISDYTGF